MADPATAGIPVGTRLVAGRGSAVDVTLRDPGVSRRHFEIENHGDRLVLRDVGSKGGTRVNGVDTREATIGPGDVIEAGASRLLALQVQPMVPPLDPGSLEVVHYDGSTVSGRRPLNRPLTVGRLPECDIVIDHPQVSRRHLEIRPTSDGAVVTDLAPANRVEVNGRTFGGSRAVTPGDRIHLAGLDQMLVLEAPDARPGPLEVEVAAEGSLRAWSVEIDTGPECTVTEVAAEVAGLLGATAVDDRCWTLYRPETGTVLHPLNRWTDAGVKRGDGLALMRVEVPRGGVEAVRYGPPRITLTQLPRGTTPPSSHLLRLPRPPESQSLRGRGITWQIAGGLGIIAAGLLIALIRPSYALFAVVGGVVGVVSIGAGIMGEQSRRKHAVRRFRERLTELDIELREVRRRQAELLHEVNPSPSQAVQWIAGRNRRLWERRPDDADFLRLRIGIGRRPALIATDDSAVLADGPHAGELHGVLDRHRFLDEVPILAGTPATAPVVGVVGSRRDVLEVASWLVLQAATLHAPAELEIAIPSVNEDWMWARWLPHVERPDGIDVTWNESDAAALARRLAARSNPDHGSAGDRPGRLVVIPHGAGDAVVEALMPGDTTRSLHLVLADHVADLPSRVDAILTVDGEVARLEGSPGHETNGPISVDRVDHTTAARAARHMGRYVDGRKPPRHVSSQLGLLDLLGPGEPGRIDIAELWGAPPTPPLSAVIGTTLDEEPLVLGLRSDGVHGVVGGTTGSGKSEFLQTFLMSLALTHRPQQLSFFLIDFKGGATFAGLASLPHVAGVVTDLEQDATLAGRAFTALEAEMARRKQILEAARVPGLLEYEQLPEAAIRPLPALLVVIDEFALLVRQQPEVKDRLDLVATQGRSLGVHLLLATQSPSNVITPSIRSNTQLWLSLRVVDDSESVELLGQRDAARIPSDRPGRGFVRFGGSQSITGFQTARIARPSGDGASGPAVSVRPFADTAPGGAAAPVRREPPARGRVVTELEEACAQVVLQSRRLGIPSAIPLWLEPLPESVPAPTQSDGLIREPGHLTALVGLRDDPAHTLQEPWSVDLVEAGNLLVVGRRGSGKSATLRQVTVDLAEQHSPAHLHIHCVEAGTGSLRPLDRLPHCAVVTPVADRERLYRTFERLVRLMGERRESLAASGAGDFQTWRRTTALPEPWVLLVIDDYPALREVADGSGLGLLSDQLLSLAQGGPAVGIHVLASTSQPSDMRMNLVNLFGSRVLLRQVDAADYSLLELRLRPNELPPAMPGRALVAGGHEMQVYQSAPERLDELASAWDVTGGPAPIVRLPAEIRLGELPGAVPEGPVIGVGGGEHHPLGLDLDRGEPHLVIAGEGRSGRSTALLTVFEALTRHSPTPEFTILTPRPSPLRRLAGRPTVTVAAAPDEITAALADLASAGPASRFLLIDDAESLASDHGQRLEPLLRDAGQSGLRTIAAGRTTDLTRSFEGWLRYLLSLRSGIVLMPGPDGGLVFDVRLPLCHTAMTPGRGFMCERGRTTFVQIALPDAANSGDAR